MKKMLWILAAAMLVLPLAANAADVRVVAPGGGWGLGGRQKAGMWKQMTYDTRCPAALCLLDEIYTKWSGKQNKAYAGAKAKVPRLAAADRKDPAKRKDYRARRAAAYKDAQVPLPVGQIKNILTPEQTEKLNSAAKVLADWSKWLTEYLAGFDKQLDAILGPAPAARGYWWYIAQQYSALDLLRKGASRLGDRLGLTDKQKAQLQQVFAQEQAELRAMNAPLAAVLGLDKNPKKHSAAVRSLVGEQALKIVTEKFARVVEAILTQDQRDKLTKAMAVVAERDKGLVASYVDYAAKVNNVLPAPARKPGAPIIMRAPGGGVHITLPRQKTGAAGGGRAIVIPGGAGGGVSITLPR